jgi:hypothetical protein
VVVGVGGEVVPRPQEEEEEAGAGAEAVLHPQQEEEAVAVEVEAVEGPPLQKIARINGRFRFQSDFSDSISV